MNDGCVVAPFGAGAVNAPDVMKDPDAREEGEEHNGDGDCDKDLLSSNTIGLFMSSFTLFMDSHAIVPPPLTHAVGGGGGELGDACFWSGLSALWRSGLECRNWMS